MSIIKTWQRYRAIETAIDAVKNDRGWLGDATRPALKARLKRLWALLARIQDRLESEMHLPDDIPLLRRLVVGLANHAAGLGLAIDEEHESDPDHISWSPEAYIACELALSSNERKSH